MQQKTKRSLKKNVANFFGSFGYLFCLLQWFWAVLLYFSILQSLTLLVTPSVADEQQTGRLPSFTFTLPGSLEIIIMVAVVVVMVVITAYILIKIPMSVAKTSNKVVHKAAETMAPIVIKAQHKPDTKKARIQITSRLMLIIKLLLVIIPLIFAAASGLLEKQSVEYSVAMAAGYGLAGASVMFFAVQYALVGLLRVRISDAW